MEGLDEVCVTGRGGRKGRAVCVSLWGGGCLEKCVVCVICSYQDV